MKRYITHESQTTKLGFEDIGELATQEANCTEVNVTEDVRKLFGIDIPFTQSKYIYSYNVIVKAGYDFGEIRYEVKKDSIKVKLPEVRILSSQVDEDSFRVYHEKESIFNQIRLEENNAAFAKLKEQAEKDAVANGLYENARSNAKTILKGNFAQAYDLDDYKITFEGGEEGIQMKNKILLVLGIIAAAIAIFYFIFIFDGIGKRVRREDVDCLCCP